jgi:hypothetical protein
MNQTTTTKKPRARIYADGCTVHLTYTDDCGDVQHEQYICRGCYVHRVLERGELKQVFDRKGNAPLFRTGETLLALVRRLWADSQRYERQYARRNRW